MDKEEAKKLADEHWGYTKNILLMSGCPDNMKLLEYLYKQAMVHGIKHGWDNG